MQHKLFQYILVGVFVVALFYGLPLLGRPVRALSIRVRAFLANIYHAQERGRQLEAMQKENLALTQHLVAVEQLTTENELLRNELGVQKSPGQRHLLLAYVIGQGSFASKDSIIIDKGLRDGLKGGELIIISPDTLVGQVQSVFNHYAVVSLLFNTQLRIPAISNAQSKGIVHGEVGHQVLLDEVSQASPLQEGDIIVTDNQTATIPANLLIGKVAKIVSKPTDVVKQAQLNISIDSATLDQVFIILPL